METTNWIGFIAGTLTTIAFLPQVQRTWATKSADDMSLAMLVAFTTGVFLWLIYGVALAAWPIIVTNAITFILTSTILVLKLKYQKKRR
ncbi:MAG: SemiSWEET family sugar transporter [Nitrospira sp.]|nr:SemiSWEET family sugar transporter [Nitrospira sp.]